MALTATTLAGAKATNDVVINLTSATGAAKKMWALVDSEWMRITDVSLTPVLNIVPGYNGSAAMPHGILAPVVFGVTTDFAIVGIQPGSVILSTSFGVDGAITGPGGTGTVPTGNTIVYLTKASAGAYTIALPAKDQQNTITFISTTAAAHVVTMTGNPSANDVATFTAAIGSSFTIKGGAAAWTIVSTGNVTVA
jgi:hypothetical protein